MSCFPNFLLIVHIIHVLLLRQVLISEGMVKASTTFFIP